MSDEEHDTDRDEMNMEELHIKVLDFREKVLVALTKIQTNLDAHIKANDEFVRESKADRAEVKVCITKIPDIEKGLNNHLKTHDTFKRYLMYPIVVILLAGFGALIWQSIIHIISYR